MSDLANLNLRDALDGRRTFAQPASSAQSIEVECTRPNCRGRFRVKAVALGKKVTCPVCGAGIVVQAPPPRASAEPASPPAAAARPGADAETQQRQEALRKQHALRQREAARQAEAQRQQEEARQAEQAAQAAEALRRQEAQRLQEALRQREALQQQEAIQQREAARRAEEEQRRREAEQARLQAQEQRRRQAEDAARRQAQEQARQKAEEQRRQQQAQERSAAQLESLTQRLATEEPLADPLSAEFQEAFAARTAASRQAFAAWQQASPLECRPAFESFAAEELRRWRLERHALAHDAEASGFSGTLPRQRFGGGLASFLLAPLEVTFCGGPVTTAVGLLNPYRLASASADVPLAQLSPRLQQAREPVLRGQQALIDVGLEWVVSSRQSFHSFQASHWRKPAARLLAQLTWMQLGPFSQQVLEETQSVTSELFLAHLAHQQAAAESQEAALLRHAQAVCWLHIAIAREAAFAAGRMNNALGYWDLALECWAEVLADESFWHLLRQPDTQTLLPAVRAKFPVLLAGWIGRFAKAYGERGDSVSCQRLLSTLRRSRLPEAVRNQGALAAVRGSFY